jgi:hypothetical protein
MRLKRPKKTKEETVKARCDSQDRNALQLKANLYTEGNLSEWLVFAGKNFVPSKEDFETPKNKKGRK